jgi:hypothetical protein
MSVPSAINSTRQQIVEAVKLSLAGVATFIDLPDSWGLHNKESEYPLGKVYAGTSTLSAQYIGHTDIREDDLILVVCPWCDKTDFELKTSLVMETFAPLMNVEKVREQMYSTYQGNLANITLNSIEILETNIANPYASVKLSYKMKYKITT